MAVRAQSSSSSLSRDFCNSFWGVGDAGVNVLCARMRGATKTSDDLRKFWKQRSLIEEEYSNKLMELAQLTIGKDEVGELKVALDTLKQETEKLSSSHGQLASQIRTEMEEPLTRLLNKQMEHRRAVQNPLEKRFKAKQAQESYVAKAREKYQGDCIRINSYTQQIENQGRDIERIQRRLQTAQQTVQANERDYLQFSKVLTEMQPEWEAEWKSFCDSCQDLEEERAEFMKDNLWTYANAVSTVCVTDDLSCEAIRTALDQLDPERDVVNFVQDYGTGNAIQEPVGFVAYDGNADPTQPITRPARFVRKSNRSYNGTGTGIAAAATPPQPEPPAPVAVQAQPAPAKEVIPRRRNDSLVNGQQTQQAQATSSIPVVNGHSHGGQTHTTMQRRESVPLPQKPQEQPVVANPPSPPPPAEATGGVLFYVKALYDYQATIEEEFDFQAGDVIAVTATPDDGWWSGELLDEARREEGRHIFPSNFTVLF